MKRICFALSFFLCVSSMLMALEGDPVTSIEVQVGKKPPGEGVVVARGDTDAEGSISFSKLKAGTYFVRFWHSGLIHEISKNGSGEKLRISKDAVRRAKNGDSPSSDGIEKFTVNFGEVAAIIEMAGNSITVTIIEP